jgi:DNA-binding CsgD family transcriptional regulator
MRTSAAVVEEGRALPTHETREPSPTEMLWRGEVLLSELVALSPREVEILRLVGRGLPNKCIAAVLEIQPSTVDTYLRRIFAKLGVRSRSAAVARFLTNYEIPL